MDNKPQGTAQTFNFEGFVDPDTNPHMDSLIKVTHAARASSQAQEKIRVNARQVLHKTESPQAMENFAHA
jgi:hypothetical protein